MNTLKNFGIIIKNKIINIQPNTQRIIFKTLKFTITGGIGLLSSTTISHYIKYNTTDTETKKKEEEYSQKITNFTVETNYKLIKRNDNLKTVVILHDICETSSLYQKFIETLSNNKNINILVYDRPGYGLRYILFS
jgi:predicted transcriptional regulator